MSNFKQTYKKVNDLINLIAQVSCLANARHYLVTTANGYTLANDINSEVTKPVRTIAAFYDVVQAYYDSCRYSCFSN